MHKETVQYQDFSEVNHTEVVYFNITKTDLLGRLELIDRTEQMAKILQGPPRELSTPEKQEMLDLIKAFMELAYGILSDDGKKHKKTPEIWEDFRSTALYDALLFSLFTVEDKANNFFQSVLPAELVAEVRSEQTADIELPSTPLTAVPDEDRTLEHYTREELLALPQDKFDELAGTDPSKMARPVLEVAMQRKNQS